MRFCKFFYLLLGLLAFSLPAHAAASLSFTINQVTITPATIQSGQTLDFSASFTANENASGYHVGFLFLPNGSSTPIEEVVWNNGINFQAKKPVVESSSWTIPAGITPGTYTVDIDVWNAQWTWVQGTTVTFVISPTVVNGSCGASNGADLTSTPTTGLCGAGTASSVAGTGPWSWSCIGTNGGTPASCSALLEVNGSCGASNSATLTSAPTTNLCSAGTASSVAGTGPWSWSCTGTNGGSASSCAAQLAPHSFTVSALTVTPTTVQAGQTLNVSASFTSNKAASGYHVGFVFNQQGSTTSVNTSISNTGINFQTNTPVAQSGSWAIPASTAAGTYAVEADVWDANWNWVQGATSTFVISPVAVNGACGSANGVAVASAPTTNLCSAGTASSVSGSGPWNWSCAGSKGGTTATCLASVATPVNGVCSGTVGDCTSGSAIDVNNISGTATWTCEGSNGGTSESCPVARNILLQPFASTAPDQISVWNMPLSTEASYEAANITNPPNSTYDDINLLVLTPSAPSTQVAYNSAGWTGGNRCSYNSYPLTYTSTYVPVPTDYYVPDISPGATENNQVAILEANGQSLFEFAAMQRCNDGDPIIGTNQFGWGTATINLYTDGATGLHGAEGVGSNIGGTIRLNEIMPCTNSNPNSCSPINGIAAPMTHVLEFEQMGLFSNTAYWQKNAANCADGQGNCVYPATNGDGGNEGLLVALPPSFNYNSLKTAPARSIAWTLINYGAYIVDNPTWNATGFVWEISSTDATGGTQQCAAGGGDVGNAGQQLYPQCNGTSQFIKNWGFSVYCDQCGSPWEQDMATIVSNLQVVTNMSYHTDYNSQTGLNELWATLPSCGTSCLLQPLLPPVLPP